MQIPYQIYFANVEFGKMLNTKVVQAILTGEI